jgi:hypothetical protein
MAAKARSVNPPDTMKQKQTLPSGRLETIEALMTKLTLTSPHDGALKPLIEGAISKARRSTKTGISRCEERLLAFEQQYGIKSVDFLPRYENDELPETLELGEWIGEIRMLQRLQDKAERLRGVEFVY